MKNFLKSIFARLSSTTAQSAEEGSSKNGPVVTIGYAGDAGLDANFKSIFEYMRRKNYKVEDFYHKHSTRQNIAEMDKKGLVPDVFFLDVVCMEGEGENVIDWCKQHHPDKPLPAIFYISTSPDISASAAGDLSAQYPEVNTSFVTLDEIFWVDSYLKNPDQTQSFLGSIALREFMNATFKTEMPLKYGPRYDELAERMNNFNISNAKELLRYGQTDYEGTLDKLRASCLRIASTLQKSTYQDQEGLTKDLSFFAGTGFVTSGPAVFSIEDAKTGIAKGENPILVMRGYDPEVVRLIDSGKLGGIVTTSAYMGSHLKALCEAAMISGLFGLNNEEENLSRAFNQSMPLDFKPYFQNAEERIFAGQKIYSGQNIAIGVGKNGLMLRPPERKILKPCVTFDEMEREQRKSIENLREVNTFLQNYFKKEGAPQQRFASNVSSTNDDFLIINEIGLVRTEQMVSVHKKQLQKLKTYLATGEPEDLADLAEKLEKDYYHLLREVGNKVNFRLFDFVHSEILNSQERVDFVNRYGRADIHGGAALAQWPDLYSAQLNAIFAAGQCWKQNFDWEYRPQIMMPAVRTATDVQSAQAMVTQAASGGSYNFGVMIETTDACANIATIAPLCQFISFGTNDLTQELLGISRSDLKAQAAYETKHGFNPFQTLAPEVLGLIEKVIKEAKLANPKINISLCGAQGAEIETADKLFNVGVDTISTAPTLFNIYALPLLLSYRRYDDLRAQVKAQAPEHGRSSLPPSSP